MATSASRQLRVQIRRDRKRGSQRRGVGTMMETFPIDRLDGTLDRYNFVAWQWRSSRQPCIDTLLQRGRLGGELITEYRMLSSGSELLRDGLDLFILKPEVRGSLAQPHLCTGQRTSNAVSDPSGNEVKLLMSWVSVQSIRYETRSTMQCSLKAFETLLISWDDLKLLVNLSDPKLGYI